VLLHPCLALLSLLLGARLHHVLHVLMQLLLARLKVALHMVPHGVPQALHVLLADRDPRLHAADVVLYSGRERGDDGIIHSSSRPQLLRLAAAACGSHSGGAHGKQRREHAAGCWAGLRALLALAARATAYAGYAAARARWRCGARAYSQIL
jgi:hypothetical protein